MRSSSFIKISAIALVVVVMALGTGMGVHAGPLAQDTSTPAATMVMAGTMAAPAATVAAPAATTAANTGASAAATSVTYPPCTSQPATAAAAATMQATAAGTTSAAAATAVATAAATVAVNPNPAYLGVIAESVDTCGARIVQVVGDPARLGRLQAGDIVVAVDGQALTGVASFRTIVESHKPGDQVTITIQRNGTQMDLSVQLGARPAKAVPTMAATTAPVVVGTSAASGAATSAAAASATPAATTAVTP